MLVYNVEGLLFEHADGVAKITLNRPEKLNALDFPMVEGLTAWIDECGEREDVRVIVVTGAGRAFCSGDDIIDGMGKPAGGDVRGRLTPRRGPHYEMVKTLLSAPKPVVAALNGRCHGAGWVLALACDFRVARSDALIGDIRSEKAIFANQGVGLMLPRLIGQSRAIDLLMTGRVIDAVEAERFGIVQRLWSPEAFDEGLAAFIAGLANGPTRTYAAWKLTVNRSMLVELDAYTDYERWANMALGETDDVKEGRLSFREKRQPRFVGH